MSGVDSNECDTSEYSDDNSCDNEDPHVPSTVRSINHQIETAIPLDDAYLSNEIKTLFEELTWEEQYEWIHQKILKGDRLRDKNKKSQAIIVYQEALLGIKLCNNKNNEILQRIKEELEFPCIISFSKCLLDKMQLKNAFKLCEMAILISNKSSYKPYYIRGKIYEQAQDFEKAREDYSTALKLCNEDIIELEIMNKLKNLESNDNEIEQSEKLSKGNSSGDSDYEDLESGKKILHYNDDFEELNKFGYLKYLAYPIKMTIKYIKNKGGGCCRRRKDGYNEFNEGSPTSI